MLLPSTKAVSKKKCQKHVNVCIMWKVKKLTASLQAWTDTTIPYALGWRCS